MTPRKGKFLPYNPQLRARARELRRNGTLGEVLLWNALRKKALGCEFHRQVPISEYIVDFFCPERMLAIEVDGSGHEHEEVYANDVRRQASLEAVGVRFLRFTKRDIRSNLENVVLDIQDWLAQNDVECQSHPPTPPSKGD